MFESLFYALKVLNILIPTHLSEAQNTVHQFLRMYLYPPFSMLGNGSVNTFQRERTHTPTRNNRRSDPLIGEVFEAVLSANYIYVIIT
jgi:hypothetical protein